LKGSEVSAASPGGLQVFWSSASPIDDLAFAMALAAKCGDPRAAQFSRALDLLVLNESNGLPGVLTLEDAEALYASSLVPWDFGYHQSLDGSRWEK
jgi:hypothetical protein